MSGRIDFGAAMLLAALTLILALVAAGLARRCSRLARCVRHAIRYRSAIARLRYAGRVTEAERYWEQVRKASAPILVTSPEGTVLAASPAVVAMFGYRDEEELRRLPMEAMYVNALDRTRHLRAPLHERGEVRSGEFRMKHRDGHEINVLTTARLLVAENGETRYEGVLTDITELRAALEERRRLEGQLHLSRKLELVGRLASGIAHEINTPMQFIGDNISYLKGAFERLLEGGATPELLSDVAEAFEGSFEGVERVSETMRAMKEFAHPGDVEIASTDINQALRTTLVVGRNEYKHAAEVKLELGDIPPVDCRRAELSKVFLNLIVNAAHAIEAKGGGTRGTITIRTRTEGTRVRIDIADTGCGIPPAVLPRIFDPFFTTKAVGKGSGQGLAIARTIVTGHGGEMEVASTVGQGTTFTLFLPFSPMAAAAGTQELPVDLEAPIG